MLVRCRPARLAALRLAACRRIYGYEPEELIGANPEDLISSDDLGLFRDSAQSSIIAIRLW